MESKRCYGCMKAKQQSPICEHCGYDERIQNAPHQLPVGTVLQGKYLLGRVLGQGGFGITYLGRDIKLDTTVAIKEYYPTGMVARESGIDPTVTVVTGGEDTRFAENRDRFLREARTLARLEDVGEVVQVKNFFEENNTAYIVMGYVKGITLKEHMRRSGGKLSAEEVFRLLEPLMEALQQVHELGLVHRDISPDNIMLQPNKRARLIDFGAAHAATAAGDKSTQAVLKHGFAPLEQYQRKGNLGPWTDVYAMCATVYHCITGLMPPNVADRIVGEEEFQWEALAGLTRAQLTDLKQGLTPQYKQRIQTMEELCAKLFDREEPAPQRAPMPEPIPRPQPQPVPAPKPVPQPEPKPAPKPQPRQEKPSVSETGTIALVREQPNDVPAILTAPVDNKQSIHTAPVLRQESYTAPAVQKQPAADVGNAKSQKDKQHEIGIGKFIIAIGVLALIAFLVMRLLGIPSTEVPSEGENTQSAETQQPDMTQFTDATDPQTIQEAYGSRVLMNPQIVWKEVSDGKNTWTEFNADANYAFGTKALRSEVFSITFLDNVKDAPSDAVDASKNQDGSVLAWVIPNGELYDLYIAAEGPIILPQDCNSMFTNFSALTELDMSGLDTGNVTDMSSMFQGCSNLTGLDVSGFDTGNVTNMSAMFCNCFDLTGLDVSGFDTWKVTDMSYMFAGCFNLTGLDVSGFDTGNVIDMYGMFFSCSKLTELDVSGFDTGNVTDMSFMFRGCSKLTWLDVSGFDTGNVTDMSSMFIGCSNLTELDVSGLDTGNVTVMKCMFDGCSKLTELDVSGFDTGNVTDMSFMFRDCSNLTELDVSGFDTGKVTSMGFMFYNCSNLTGLDVSGFDTGKVTDMSNMFHGCSNLTGLDVSGFDTGNVVSMSFMFFGTDKLKNVNGNFDVSHMSHWSQHSNFMDSGDTFNGRPWEELFR